LRIALYSNVFESCNLRFSYFGVVYLSDFNLTFFGSLVAIDTHHMCILIRSMLCA
jgi:hypothetical protein